LNDSKIAASISYSETYINNLFKGLLLGPLAVSPALKGKGHGKELVKYTINKIELSNIYDFIIVVGDLDYYSKFKFNKVEKNLEFYGPVDKDKVLIKLIGAKININDIEQYKFT
jgi:predicted N-acetyltransferase YhbS